MPFWFYPILSVEQFTGKAQAAQQALFGEEVLEERARRNKWGANIPDYTLIQLL